ncbi:hypothetical protein [Streptomyces sp. NPDC046821]|uniref:hypothetical protein n=1 Tax=Streptomyces sp. NPDC046821 TaxID=3154702 RepID=UPI0033F4F943
MPESDTHQQPVESVDLPKARDGQPVAARPDLDFTPVHNGMDYLRSAVEHLAGPQLAAAGSAKTRLQCSWVRRALRRTSAAACRCRTVDSEEAEHVETAMRELRGRLSRVEKLVRQRMSGLTQQLEEHADYTLTPPPPEGGGFLAHVA